jgi:hypothetical protein
MHLPAPASRTRPETQRPGREVLIALAVKGAALAGLYFLCFGPAHRSPATAAATAAALVGHPAAEPRR